MKTRFNFLGFKHWPTTLIGLAILGLLLLGWYQGKADLTDVGNILTGLTSFFVAIGLILHNPKKDGRE